MSKSAVLNKMTGALAVTLVFVSFQAAAMAQDTKKEATVTANISEPQDKKPVATERPNAFSIEALGRAALYSFNYDRSVSESVGVGLGMSYWGASAGNIKASVLILPVYTNVYFSPHSSRGFLTGGLDLVFASAKVDDYAFSGSGALAVLGGGYEYRGDGGFLFRAAPYILVGSQVQIWGGLSFGFTN
ncbi:MAG: hypothetical protein AB1540_02440 [Bdellovibrionota bacterium]